MTECHCKACSKTPHEKYSDEWKLETEANFILTMPIEQRRSYLEKLNQPRRGVLEAEIKRLWNKSRLTQDET